jgi:DNA gyrase subunit A
MPAQENKIPIAIEDEIQSSYLDYAMSVIVGRALPDVRDGLKPVHRRILYAMFREGLLHNKKYSKSAGVVGEVLKKYHPHGDMAVYDALVRMVQDFNLRYPLIDGHGNFGSVDGDPPAAYRYTEVRLARLAEELLADIDKETVDFDPNFDETTEEPLVLPAKAPNLLVNGTTGIAVGMATNIPPHNLGEIVDGLVHLIDHPDCTIPDLMAIIQGPDFPTAAMIHGRQGIVDAYTTGRGLIQMRARAVVEVNEKQDRQNIVITEIPYQVNKAKLLEKIAELVREKKITGIADFRDESDREGMRIVVELKRGEIAAVILNQLYKHTPLQATFGVIMLALWQGQPRIFHLKDLLRAFLQHRREVVVRRTQHDLRKAEERAHILEGLKIALEEIDEVIALIKRSRSPEAAQAALMARFPLSPIQAQAILDMKLQRLTGLEKEKLLAEYEDLLKTMASLREVLGSEALVWRLIREDLLKLKEEYGDARRTEILPEETEINLEDLIADEEVVITISHSGYIKRNALNLYRLQRRGGKGMIGMETKEADFVEHLFTASTHSYLLFFTDAGKVYWLKVHRIPEAGRQARGKAIVNLLQLAQGEQITAVLPVREFVEGRAVFMATRRGVAKKTDLMAFSHPRAGGIVALTLEEGDALIAAALTDGTRDVFLATRDGYSIRFKEEEVREVGRTAKGVTGIRLRGEDRVMGMEIVREPCTILTVTERGFGKRSDLSLYRLQGRGGMGIITTKVTEKTGRVVGALQVTDEDELMMITAEGKIIRVRVREISVMGRATQGVKLFDIDPQDKVGSVARLAEKDEREEGRED